MLGRTQMKAEHWREREEGNGEGEQIEEKWRKYHMDGMRPSFLLIFACLTVSNIVGQCTHVSF